LCCLRRPWRCSWRSSSSGGIDGLVLRPAPRAAARTWVRCRAWKRRQPTRTCAMTRMTPCAAQARALGIVPDAPEAGTGEQRVAARQRAHPHSRIHSQIARRPAGGRRRGEVSGSACRRPLRHQSRSDLPLQKSQAGAANAECRQHEAAGQGTQEVDCSPATGQERAGVVGDARREAVAKRRPESGRIESRM